MTVLTLAAVTALALSPACGGAELDSDFARRLVATAQAESGLDPYTIHINGSAGGTRHFRTERDAITAARALDAAGIDFDAGLMQVNRRQFAHHGLTLRIGSAFDGCTSMRAGADHLADNVRSVWTLASRRCNCGGITCGAAYARQVDALVSRVGTTASPPPAPLPPPCAPAWDAWANATCGKYQATHQRGNDMLKAQAKLKRIVAMATALPMAVTTSAFAQDVIGAAPVSQAAILTFKAIAVAGVGWGFLRLMSGRHTVEGLTVMAAGALGLAKTQAVIALLGIG